MTTKYSTLAHGRNHREASRQPVADLIDEVQHVGVNDAVETIVSERADFKHFARRVDANAHRHALVLEESRRTHIRITLSLSLSRKPCKIWRKMAAYARKDYLTLESKQSLEEPLSHVSV